MPRYHFHLEHVRVVKDSEGSDHADLAAAQIHAVKLIANSLDQAPQEFWDADVFRMTVAKPDGLALFQIEMFATLSPAASPPRPRCRS